MDFIKSLLSDFDISSLLPKLDSLLSKVELLARIVVMAGPVILLVLGLWYLLLPPKEANYAVGYRFFWGMSSVESWQFTQLVAGIVWSVLGLMLSLVMYLLSGGFRNKPLMDIVWKCVEYVFWEMGLLAVSCLIINLTVVFTFNSKGDRRREKKKNKGKTDAEVVEEEVKRFVHDVNEKLHQKPSLDKVKAAGAALLHKPPAQQVQAMPALEQPAEAVKAAEPEAVPVVEETPVAEAPVEEAAVVEAPVVIPVAAPVVEVPAAAEPAPAEEPLAAQETEPAEEKPSVLDKIKAFFASLADKSKDLFTSFAEKVKGLFASMKSKKKDEEPAAEETPEVSAEETAQEIPAEEPVETPVEETPEEAVEETAEETEAETAEETPEQSQLPLIVPPSQQRKNPYGTKKRYPKGTKKKGKK